MPLDRLPGRFFGPSTLVELLRHRAEHLTDDTAFMWLVDGEDDTICMTNGELDRRARAIGAWLESHNLVGSRALLLYPPGLEFLTAFFGCLYAGVVAVPVYPPRRNRSLLRIQSIADDAEAAVALTTEDVLQRVEPLIGETPHLKQLTWLATCDVDQNAAADWHMPDIHGDTLAFLQYTSGSTGSPKGVILDHANLLHNSALISHAFELTRSGKGVFWLPSYHDMGLIGGILQPLYIGRPSILMSPMAFLQRPYRWLRAITRHKGTISGGPNFAYELCVRKVTPEQCERLDLSAWCLAFNGAEPVRAETLDRFAEKFAPYGFRREAFYPCYGLAEATLIVSGGFAKEAPVVRHFDQEALTQDRAIETDVGTSATRSMVGCGQDMPDQKIVIADPKTKKAVPEGQVGEIWVAGPSVARGYWRCPDATKEVFQARLAESGRGPFMRTGDLGFIHQGELFVTGRVKDLIILYGVNVYPQDIERTVQESHPRLRPDNGGAFSVEVDGREELVIVQEIERRRKGDLGVVVSAIRKAVSVEHELSIHAIVLIRAGSIPKTTSGKIQRHACCKGFLKGTLSVVAQWKAGQPLEILGLAVPQPLGPAAPKTRAPAMSAPPEPAAAPKAGGNGRGKTGAHGRR